MNKGLKSAGTIFLGLLVGQLVLSLLISVVTLIVGLITWGSPTPLALTIATGLICCYLWYHLGWSTVDADQLHRGGMISAVIIWTLLTSLMINVYLIFLPQQLAGGMIREIAEAVNYDSRWWFYDFWDWPIGSLLLSASFAFGLSRKIKKLKAAPQAKEENV